MDCDGAITSNERLLTQMYLFKTTENWKFDLPGIFRMSHFLNLAGYMNLGELEKHWNSTQVVQWLFQHSPPINNGSQDTTAKIWWTKGALRLGEKTCGMAGVKLSHWQKLTQPAILSLSCSNWRIVTKWVGHHGKVWPCGCLVSCFFWTSLGPQKTQPFDAVWLANCNTYVGGWDPNPWSTFAGTSNVEVNHILISWVKKTCQIVKLQF